MTQALNRCVSCLPGQRDVDNALRAVGDASKRLLSDSVRRPRVWGHVGAEFPTLDLSLTLTSQIYPLSVPAGSVPTSQHSLTKLSLASFPMLTSDFLTF